MVPKGRSQSREFREKDPVGLYALGCLHELRNGERPIPLWVIATYCGVHKTTVSRWARGLCVPKRVHARRLIEFYEEVKRAEQDKKGSPAGMGRHLGRARNSYTRV